MSKQFFDITTLSCVILFSSLHTNNATYIVRYDKVCSEFQERLDAGNFDQDFIKLYNIRQRRELCNDILAAREYQLILPDSFLPPAPEINLNVVLPIPKTNTPIRGESRPPKFSLKSDIRSDQPLLRETSTANDTVISESNSDTKTTIENESAHSRDVVDGTPSENRSDEDQYNEFESTHTRNTISETANVNTSNENESTHGGDMSSGPSSKNASDRDQPYENELTRSRDIVSVSSDDKISDQDQPYENRDVASEASDGTFYEDQPRNNESPQSRGFKTSRKNSFNREESYENESTHSQDMVSGSSSENILEQGQPYENEQTKNRDMTWGDSNEDGTHREDESSHSRGFESTSENTLDREETSENESNQSRSKGLKSPRDSTADGEQTSENGSWGPYTLFESGPSQNTAPQRELDSETASERYESEENITPNLKDQIPDIPWRRSRSFRHTYRYQMSRIHAGRGMKRNTLQCTHSRTVNVFVTYGLRRSDLFLLGHRKRARGLVFSALIPSKSSVVPYKNNAELLTSFLHTLEIDENGDTRVPKHMNLCFLPKIAHLRLCASTFETLISEGYFVRDMRKVNFVTVSSHLRCRTMSVRMNAKLLVQKVRVVPCAVNQPDGYEDAQFYVLPAVRETASVFLLTKIDGNVDEMRVVMKVQNVEILFGVDSSNYLYGRFSVSSGKGKT